MKPAPSDLFDAAVDTSHERRVRVELLDPAGQLVDTLPVVAGTVRGTSRSVDRWAGEVLLPVTIGADDLIPRSPTHPLSGFAGYSVRVWAGAVVDGVELLVDVARLWVWGARLERSSTSVELTVELVGPASYAQQAAGREHTATAGESCQAMIRRLLLDAVPHDPAVFDSTTPDAPPDGYSSDADVWSTVQDLAARAGVAVYFDAAGDLIIRDPLPAVAGPTERRLAATVNVTGYTVAVGRDLVANEVQARFRGTDNETDIVGVAQITTGPLAVSGPAGRIVDTVDVDLVAGSQARADRYARAVLRAQQAAWLTVEVEHVPDPRIEPDDVVELVYLDGTTATHRVVTVDVPLGPDGAQVLTARTADPPQAVTALPAPH